MEEDRIFDISFQCDGRQYKGWVNPSEKTDKTGRPASYHVVLEGVYFGNLSINNCKWGINEDRPDSLTEAVGREIEKYYQL
jgi:hypothetical protein